MRSIHPRGCTVLLLLLLMLITEGCAEEQTPLAGTSNPGTYFTQAAGTVISRITQTAEGSRLNPTATLPGATVATREIQLPTPHATLEPQLSETQPPTAIFLPTETPPPQLPSVPCNQAELVQEVTVPVGMVFSPYERISKTWEVRNSGSCSWDSTYRLVLTGGEAMGYQGPFPIPQPVAPGETVLLTADLVAPEGEGYHESDFMLLSPQGELFGVGAFGGGRLAVVVQVVEQPINILYDFSQMACEAAWESDEDVLPCPGNLYDDAGFVLTLQGSDLESGHQDRTVLWTNPGSHNGSWIRGIFPIVELEKGTRFKADVGCLAGNPGCDVIFQVGYRRPGKKITWLGEWHEVEDGSLTHIDLSLNSLAGKDIQLILGVEANGSAVEDAAAWVLPHIGVYP